MQPMETDCFIQSGKICHIARTGLIKHAISAHIYHVRLNFSKLRPEYA